MLSEEMGKANDALIIGLTKERTQEQYCEFSEAQSVFVMIISAVACRFCIHVLQSLLRNFVNPVPMTLLLLNVIPVGAMVIL